MLKNVIANYFILYIFTYIDIFIKQNIPIEGTYNYKR